MSRTAGLPSSGATILLVVLSFLVSAAPSAASGEDAPDARTNFYAWANRDWLAQAVIPADKPRVDNFTALQDSVYGRMEKLVSRIRGSSSRTDEQQKLLWLFDGYVDMGPRNGLGIEPISAELDRIGTLATHEDVARRFAEFQTMGISSPMLVAPMDDFKNSTMNAGYVTQSGLTLEKDYYSGSDPDSEKRRGLYRVLLVRLFDLASIPESDTKAGDVLDVESKLAAIQWSRVENRNLENLYNPYTIPDFLELTRDLDGKSILATLGVPSTSMLIVMQPTYVEAYAKLFRETGVETWKNYLRARMLQHYANLLTADFRQAVVEYETGLGLYTEEAPRWKQALDYLTTTAPMLLGKQYVKVYFDEGQKQAITDIVMNIRDQFRTAISGAEWLTAPTKRKALDKLDHMGFKIGYLEEWLDYSALVITGPDAVGNDRRLARFEHRRSMEKIGQPVDSNEWGHSPHEINASYNPTQNEFVLLAGILQPPFFDPEGTDAMQYGGIGFVVGHEIGHGFDDQGSRFDVDGNMANWWTEEDAAAYTMIRRRVIDQANAYEILPSTFLNGELEIGEIMGDLSGAQIALGAYRKVVGMADEDGGSAEREFFIQLARTWRSKWRPDYLRLIIKSDPHPPSEFRANGIVKQFAGFYEAFDVRPGDPMYLAPEERVLPW